MSDCGSGALSFSLGLILGFSSSHLFIPAVARLNVFVWAAKASLYEVKNQKERFKSLPDKKTDMEEITVQRIHEEERWIVSVEMLFCKGNDERLAGIDTLSRCVTYLHTRLTASPIPRYPEHTHTYPYEQKDRHCVEKADHRATRHTLVYTRTLTYLTKGGFSWRKFGTLTEINGARQWRPKTRKAEFRKVAY